MFNRTFLASACRWSGPWGTPACWWCPWTTARPSVTGPPSGACPACSLTSCRGSSPANQKVEVRRESPREERVEEAREQRVVVRREAMEGWEERLGAAIREEHREVKSILAMERVAEVKINIERNLLFDDIKTKRKGSKSVFARLGKRSEVAAGSRRKEKRYMKLEAEDGKRGVEVKGGRGKGRKNRGGKGAKARGKARRVEVKARGKKGKRANRELP